MSTRSRDIGSPSRFLSTSTLLLDLSARRTETSRVCVNRKYPTFEKPPFEKCQKIYQKCPRKTQPEHFRRSTHSFVGRIKGDFNSFSRYSLKDTLICSSMTHRWYGVRDTIRDSYVTSYSLYVKDRNNFIVNSFTPVYFPSFVCSSSILSIYILFTSFVYPHDPFPLIPLLLSHPVFSWKS